MPAFSLELVLKVYLGEPSVTFIWSGSVCVRVAEATVMRTVLPGVLSTVSDVPGTPLTPIFEESPEFFSTLFARVSELFSGIRGTTSFREEPVQEPVSLVVLAVLSGVSKEFLEGQVISYTVNTTATLEGTPVGVVEGV